MWAKVRQFAAKVAGAVGLRTGRPARGSTKWLGNQGEAHAVKHLKARGYRILDRNVVVPPGEADIVAEAPDGRTIVLVEVKCRVLGDGTHPPPEAQVHEHKRRTLRAVLRYLVAANRWEARARRIDVVAIDWGERGACAVRHYEDAVRV